MAGILHNNRTLTFGEEDQLHLSEKEITDLISEHFNFDRDDVRCLVEDLIDALDQSNDN